MIAVFSNLMAYLNSSRTRQNEIRTRAQTDPTNMYRNKAANPAKNVTV